MATTVNLSSTDVSMVASEIRQGYEEVYGEASSNVLLAGGQLMSLVNEAFEQRPDNPLGYARFVIVPRLTGGHITGNRAPSPSFSSAPPSNPLLPASSQAPAPTEATPMLTVPQTPQASFLGDLAGVALGGLGGFIAGGPLGAAAGALGVLMQQQGGAPPGSTTIPQPGLPRVPVDFRTFVPQQATGGGGALPPQQQPMAQTGGIKIGPMQIGGGSYPIGGQIPTTDEQLLQQLAVRGAQVASVAMGCPSGYHANKTSYFLKDGTYVPRGSRCVRNRRRNPLNFRALNRSISRVKQAHKTAQRIEKAIPRRPARRSPTRKKC